MLELRRRQFITLLGGAAAWPLTARAQYPAIVPTVAFFVSGTPSSHGLWFAASVERLRELGWIENRTVAIEYRFAQGRQSFVDTMGELVRRKVDVIVTNGTDAALVAKQATSAIPIVLAAATDPVGTGLVASLPRPGGNITGLSLQAADLAGKRIALLREVVPGLHRLAVMVNVGSPAAVLERSEVQSAAAALGLDLVAAEIRRVEDIAPAFETLKGRASVTTCAPAASYRMERTSLFFTDGPPSWSTRSCAARGRPTCRSSSRQPSISSSTSRPPRHSASKSRKPSSPAPTR